MNDELGVATINEYNPLNKRVTCHFTCGRLYETTDCDGRATYKELILAQRELALEKAARLRNEITGLYI